MTTTSEDFAYGSAANLFGSDPESAEEHETLTVLRGRAERSHFQRGEPVRVVGVPDASDFDARFLVAHADTGRAVVLCPVRWHGGAAVRVVPVACVTPRR